MSDETFREKVEKIVAWELDRFDGSPTRMRIFTDRILAAHNARLDEIAAGMPKNGTTSHNTILWCETLDEMRDECQAHVKAQKEGM